MARSLERLEDERRRRETRSPRLCALLESLQAALNGPLPADRRRTLELAVVAYGAAADRGAELAPGELERVTEALGVAA